MLQKKLVKRELATGVDPFWGDAKSQIKRGAVTPFISNFMSARIFGGPGVVAENWAADKEVASPLTIEHNRQLARVAQYYSVQKDARVAKTHYLDSLKWFLLGLTEGEDLDPDLLEEVEEAAAELSYSEVAHRLGYPRYPEAQHNPLRLLAELPLPIYITTSYHDFLEVALSRATSQKEPVSEIFYRDDTLQHIPSIYEREPNYEPSVARPLVYHLYGLDTYPESLVLSEDDYLDFLVKMAAEEFEVHHSDQQKRIPSSVLKALSGTSLLLLGYDVYDWEFRALFRGLIRAKNDSRRNNPNVAEGISMQIEPGQDHNDPARVKAYLDKYFKLYRFKVYWGDVESCVQALWDLWKG